MPIESILPWVALIDRIWSAIEKLREKKRVRQKEIEQVLLILSEAYHTTIVYSKFLEKNQRDPEKEMDIAASWHNLSILLKKYDSTLSQITDLKSQYWREGAMWSKKAIEDAGIGLQKVLREINIHPKLQIKPPK